MDTEYLVLKKHFDKLIKGGFPQSNSLEPIRDNFARAFGRQINLFDVYRDPVNCKHNPIHGIVTLIGPSDKIDEYELPEGIMADGRDISFVSVISEDIFKGFSNSSEKASYAASVYDAMYRICQLDRFWLPDEHARINPYPTVVKCLPLYLTYNHVRECVGIDDELNESFENLLEKYIVTDGADKVMESLASSKFSADCDDIYSIMTCKRSVDLFW